MAESSFSILKRMRSQKLSQHLKLAEENKKTFEENFYRLTDAIISEQNPKLKDYDLGFQLIDKSKDNSKAFGIRAFRLRSLVFIPFFYDNGNVVGYNLLYLPAQNLFLPNTEAWVSYLKRKDTADLGKPDLYANQLNSVTQPYLLPLRRPIITKTSEFLKKCAEFVPQRLILPDCISDPEIARRFIGFIAHAPYLAPKVASLYGIGIFDKALKAAREVEHVPRVAVPVRVQEKNAQLEIYTEFTDNLILTPTEREQLAKTGYYIRDKRNQESISETTELIGPQTFMTIATPGVYDIIDGDLKVRTIIAIKCYDSPNQLILIDPKTKECDTSHPGARSANLTMQRMPVAIKKYPSEKLTEILKKLPKISAKMFSENAICDVAGETNPCAVIIAPNLEGDIYSCDSKGLIDVPRNKYFTQASRIHEMSNRGINFPVDCKVFHGKRVTLDFLLPGDIITILNEKGIKTIKAAFLPAEDKYIINGKTQSRLDALISLMADYGLRKKDANLILKKAARNKKVYYAVKMAGAWEAINTERPGFYFPGDNMVSWSRKYPGRGPVEAETYITGLKRPQPQKDITLPPDPGIFSVLQRLADSNDGEVFDLGLISTLTHGMKTEKLIESYIPRVIQGLDALGRILFGLYRHKEKMMERFGESDYKKILDNSETNFENLGELVVNLTQQNIDPYLRGFEPMEPVTGDEGESGD